MSETREPPTIECPVCGEQLAVLKFQPDEAHPFGWWSATEDDQHICPDCGWTLRVTVAGEEGEGVADLAPVSCRHGTAAHEDCAKCEAEGADRP